MWIAIIVLIIVCLILAYRLKSQQTQLSECRNSDKKKSAFIKALAREIRTPLHSVSGLAEIISKDDLYLSKEEKKNISSQIKYNANLISTLLDEVSIYSEDGSTGHQLVDERFSPNRICQRCIDANLQQVKQGVRLLFRHSMGDEQFVSADRHIVELVLNKLVHIACKFTQKGEIAVGCSKDETRRAITFFVEDTGGGIPVERRSALFQWTETTDDAKDEETEFELTIAHKLAMKIDGYLRWDNTYTKGTRMEFTLPVR